MRYVAEESDFRYVDFVQLLMKVHPSRHSLSPPPSVLPGDFLQLLMHGNPFPAP